MYGTQTFPYAVKAPHQFENDVEMYGTQTFNERNTVERVVRE